MADAATEKRAPIVLIILGFLGYAVAGFAMAGPKGPALAMGIAGVSVLIGVPLMLLAAYATAAITQQSFGELNTALLKLTAIYLFAGALGTIPWLGWLLSLIALYALLVWLFELELPYAIAFMIVLWVVRFLVTILVLMIFR
jgi:hypothetical protein